MGIPIPGKNGLYIETGPWGGDHTAVAGKMVSCPQHLWTTLYEEYLYIAVLVVHYGISNTIVLEIP